MVVEIHMPYFLKLWSAKDPVLVVFHLPCGSEECLASNRLAFWTYPWHLLSAFRNTEFWSSKKSKEVSEMTHWSTVSHTVAYLWKPVKPRWQTVWYAAISSGGGGLAKAVCKSERQRTRRRWAVLGQPAGRQQWMGLCVPVQGGKQRWTFPVIFIHTDYHHSSPKYREKYEKPTHSRALNHLSLVFVSFDLFSIHP